MGLPGMAEKYQNLTTHIGGRRRIPRPDPGASGEVGCEILLVRSPRRSPPPWPAHVARGWPKTPPTAKTRLA